MRSIIVSTITLCLCLAPLTATAAPAAAAGASDDAKKGSAKDRILGALDLPIQAQALRKAGADEQEIKAGLKAARDKKLDARSTAELIGEVAKATKEHGPIGEFGAFVKGKLEAGLRGKELAEAIRQEHATRGKGKAGDKGKPDAAGGPPDDKGKPADAGDKAKPAGK